MKKNQLFFEFMFGVKKRVSIFALPLRTSNGKSRGYFVGIGVTTETFFEALKEDI